MRKVLGGMAATVGLIASVVFWSAVKAALTDPVLGPQIIFWGIVSVPLVIVIVAVVQHKQARAAELARQQWPPLPEFQALPPGWQDQQWPPVQQKQWPPVQQKQWPQ